MSCTLHASALAGAVAKTHAEEGSLPIVNKIQYTVTTNNAVHLRLTTISLLIVSGTDEGLMISEGALVTKRLKKCKAESNHGTGGWLALRGPGNTIHMVSTMTDHVM